MPAQVVDRLVEEFVAGRERIRIQRQWGSRVGLQLGYRRCYQVDCRIDSRDSERVDRPWCWCHMTLSSWNSIG